MDHPHPQRSTVAVSRRMSPRQAAETPFQQREADMTPACHGKTDVMYDGDRVKEAKALCATCPVLARCRTRVMATDADSDLWGVWGGLTPSERQRERTLRIVRHWW